VLDYEDKGVVQNGRFMGYTESGQSRAKERLPCFACNPDLNHAEFSGQPEFNRHAATDA